MSSSGLSDHSNQVRKAQENSKAGSRNFERHAEAERFLREAVQGREKVLGIEHEDTLSSKDTLGDTLYYQQKYVEAERFFREAAQGRERVLGAEHEKTLWSKHNLAWALYTQKKYIEAERVFRETIQGRERVLGPEHKDTLSNKNTLGDSLYYQQKYVEAERFFREAAQGREKVLGAEHKDTLTSKDNLGWALHRQQRHIDAERSRETAQGREKVLEVENADTIRSEQALQELSSVQVPSTSVTTVEEETIHSRLSNFFADERGRYTDSDIGEISLLLNHFKPLWGKVPRTYIILRRLKCLNLLDELIDVGFSDHWFPVTERNLPNCLRPSQRKEFVTIQDLVITKSVGLEKGERGQHAYYRQNESLPFESKGIIGSGGTGQVDIVLSLISFKRYARKRVPRSQMFGGRRMEIIKQIINEIEILKRLKHEHVVEIVGSYTDTRYMGFIMAPIAEMDLSTYLTVVDRAKYGELRTFFGCLAKALEFLHEQKIRHKDIKPSNVLVHGGKVLLTDFGLSLDFTLADGSTTDSTLNGMTIKYCAPEVARLESRNTASDIWSLGLIFLEMAVVLKGRSTNFIYEFFNTCGSRQTFVRSNPVALVELVKELKGTGNVWDDRPFIWAQSMLQERQELRPTAAAVFTSIVAPGLPSEQTDGSGRFCGICCTALHDDFSNMVVGAEDGYDILDSL